VRRGLALARTNYSNAYLGIETNLWSSGSGPGTLAPRVGWGGVQNLFHIMLQVSTALDLLDICFNDVKGCNRVHASLFRAIFDPLLKG